LRDFDKKACKKVRRRIKKRVSLPLQLWQTFATDTAQKIHMRDKQNDLTKTDREKKQARLSGTSDRKIAKTSLPNFYNWLKHNWISCRHNYWFSLKIRMWVVMKNRRTRLKTIYEKILNWKMTNNNYIMKNKNYKFRKLKNKKQNASKKTKIKSRL